MLTINHLKKSFNERTILNDMSIEVAEGQTISIIGPSGAGKSTFLRCINLLDMPDSGEIIIDDVHLKLPKISQKEMVKARRKTTMVFQQYNLFKNKTVLQNVMESLLTVKKMKKEEAREISLEALEHVGMEKRIDAYPSQLSGGQQQRVGIARAAVVEPKLMLFDEPTSSLDPESISGILELIAKQRELGRTMLIVTHEMNFAKQVSDLVFVMENGEFIESGSPEEIFEHPTHQRTKEFLSNSH